MLYNRFNGSDTYFKQQVDFDKILSSVNEVVLSSARDPDLQSSIHSEAHIHTNLGRLFDMRTAFSGDR